MKEREEFFKWKYGPLFRRRVECWVGPTTPEHCAVNPAFTPAACDLIFGISLNICLWNDGSQVVWWPVPFLQCPDRPHPYRKKHLIDWGGQCCWSLSCNLKVLFYYFWQIMEGAAGSPDSSSTSVSLKSCGRFLSFTWAGWGGVSSLWPPSLNSAFEVTVGRVLKTAFLFIL